MYFNQRAKEQFKKGYEAYIDKKGQKKYKPSKGYDSYKSGYSNVAILWEMYDTSIPYQDKVYIEGPGTEAPVGGSRYFADEEGLSSSGKGDSVVIGEGLGMGDTGIGAKVDRAFKVIEDKVLSIYNNMNKKIIKSITFDVFGFSRGATESRIFARKIFVKNNLLSKKLKSCNINRANEIEYYINFLGLFDTVASHKTRVLYDSSKDESLYIPQNVSMVVHLVAADDYRCYFPLTTVSSAYEKEKKCIEYALPGAHSDIGGGYADTEKEILYMGSKFPSQKTIHDKDSKDFRGYMVLLCFCTTTSYSCIQDFDLLNRFQERYSEHLRIISICADQDSASMHRFVKATHYQWTFLHYGDAPNLIRDYDVRTYPTYFLLDPEGRIILSPAPGPQENLDRILFEQFRQRRWQPRMPKSNDGRGMRGRS